MTIIPIISLFTLLELVYYAIEVLSLKTLIFVGLVHQKLINTIYRRKTICLVGFLLLILVLWNLEPISESAPTLMIGCLSPSVASSSIQFLNKDLHPLFVTGFCDAESCFYIKITPSKKTKTGFIVQLSFKISLHKNDRALMEKIRVYFKGVGNISKDKEDSIQYQVSSIKDLAIIIEHFDNFPLITHKLADYILFKQAFNLINRKEHISLSGLQSLVAIKASINLGLSDALKAAFPASNGRPLIIDQKIKDPNWLVGFVEGEGCFLIDAFKAETKTGYKVKLKFQITQHIRDEQLMRSLVSVSSTPQWHSEKAMGGVEEMHFFFFFFYLCPGYFVTALPVVYYRKLAKLLSPPLYEVEGRGGEGGSEAASARIKRGQG